MSVGPTYLRDCPFSDDYDVRLEERYMPLILRLNAVTPREVLCPPDWRWTDWAELTGSDDLEVETDYEEWRRAFPELPWEDLR